MKLQRQQIRERKETREGGEGLSISSSTRKNKIIKGKVAELRRQRKEEKAIRGEKQSVLERKGI